MNTFDASMAVASIIGALVFCLISCHLCDNWSFYSQSTKEKIALANIFIGVVTMIAFAYATIQMQFTSVDQSQFTTNVVACTLVVLELAGLFLFLMSLNEFRVFRRQKC